MKPHHPLSEFRWSQRPPLTKTGLARQLGVSTSLVSLIESGGRQISNELLPEICRLTGLRPEALRPDLPRKGRARV